MIKTDEFSKDLCRTLTELLRALEWRCGWCREGRERVDLVGVPKKEEWTICPYRGRTSAFVSSIKYCQDLALDKKAPIPFEAAHIPSVLRLLLKARQSQAQCRIHWTPNGTGRSRTLPVYQHSI
jgi:hypothetical protein